MRIPVDSTQLNRAYGVHQSPQERLSQGLGPPAAETGVKGPQRKGASPISNQAPGQLERLVDIYGEKKLKQMGIIPCQTCESRVYQDQSDDPGVSFKTGAHVSPEQSHGAVLAHEQEHVSREQQKAEAEDRQVISQSVTLYKAICPECGKNYTSGGVTRTTTMGESKATGYDQPAKGDLSGAHLDLRI